MVRITTEPCMLDIVTRNIEGVNTDLVIQSLQCKGSDTTIGMQAVELESVTTVVSPGNKPNKPAAVTLPEEVERGDNRAPNRGDRGNSRQG
jgi:hypothetical protein